MKKYVLCALAIGLAAALHLSASAADIVLYASDVTTMQGSWAKVSAAGAAGGMYVGSTDSGWSSTDTALASPSQYFESTFTAASATPYHVWLRLRASGDSKWNDSVWVQFSDATDQNGSPIYRIGTTSALLVNLESCSGCGLNGWGWLDGAYWLSQMSTIRFPSTGTHTVRVQVREDGVEVDQIVLSPSLYISSAPGGVSGDSTIVAKPGSTSSSSSTTSSSSTGPFHGTPAAVPGTIQAEDFDNGGEGVAYHDTDATNNGGAYRQTGVDIESASGGGYDVGWIASGEWMNYTVNVASAGTYTVQLRVASPGGGSMHVGFNTASNVWTTVAVPATGGWQTWSTVSFTASLGAGTQQMTLMSDTGGYNLDSVTITSSGSSVAPPAAPLTPPPSSTTDITVIEWNIQVDDSSAAHAKTVIDRMVALSPQPQIIVMEEARQTQYATYLSELSAQTGRTWTGVMQTHCPPGKWTGSSCSGSEDEGVVVFSSLPMQNMSVGYLPYADAYHSARALVRAAITVNGGTVQVFGTHLQQGNATARASSMIVLKNWAAQYSKPQLVAGDFNADVDQIDTQAGMASAFVDSWSVVGSGSGYTASTPSPTMKLDYWFADLSGKAQPQWSTVVTSTGTISDHFPVMASFRISQ